MKLLWPGDIIHPLLLRAAGAASRVRVSSKLSLWLRFRHKAVLFLFLLATELFIRPFREHCD